MVGPVEVATAPGGWVRVVAGRRGPVEAGASGPETDVDLREAVVAVVEWVAAMAVAAGLAASVAGSTAEARALVAVAWAGAEVTDRVAAAARARVTEAKMAVAAAGSAAATAPAALQAGLPRRCILGRSLRSRTPPDTLPSCSPNQLRRRTRHRS